MLNTPLLKTGEFVHVKKLSTANFKVKMPNVHDKCGWSYLSPLVFEAMFIFYKTDLLFKHKTATYKLNRTLLDT